MKPKPQPLKVEATIWDSPESFHPHCLLPAAKAKTPEVHIISASEGLYDAYQVLSERKKSHPLISIQVGDTKVYFVFILDRQYKEIRARREEKFLFKSIISAMQVVRKKVPNAGFHLFACEAAVMEFVEFFAGPNKIYLNAIAPPSSSRLFYVSPVQREDYWAAAFFEPVYEELLVELN